MEKLVSRILDLPFVPWGKKWRSFEAMHDFGVNLEKSHQMNYEHKIDLYLAFVLQITLKSLKIVISHIQ